MADAMIYRYAAPSWEMAASILAALGPHDSCYLVPDRRLVAAVLVGLALVAVAATAVAAPALLEMRDATHIRECVLGSAVVGFLAGKGVVAVLAHPACWGSQVGQAGVRLGVALVVGEVLLLFALSWLSAPRRVHLDTGPARFLDAHRGLGRFADLGAITPNYGTYFGFPEVNVNDLPIPRSYARFSSRELDPNTSPLWFTGYRQTFPSGFSAAQAARARLAHMELPPSGAQPPGRTAPQSGGAAPRGRATLRSLCRPGRLASTVPTAVSRRVSGGTLGRCLGGHLTQ